MNHPTPINLTGKDKERFWSKVKIGTEAECWEWQGCMMKTGYGCMRFGGNPGKLKLAHRVSYTISNGEIAKDMQLCHKCDNRKCVNPSHLFEGTQKDNIHDMISKGRNNNISMKGEENGASKLKEVEVVDIIKKKRNGVSTDVLMAKYNISRSTICLIARGKKWAHVVA